MNFNDGIIDKWADEALEDLGDKGWREIDPNSMMLIIYNIQKTRDGRLVKKITKPIWWLLAVIGSGVVWLIVSGLIGIG